MALITIGSEVVEDDDELAIIVDLETGEEVEADTIEFVITTDGDGIVYVDGEEFFRALDIDSYEELQDEFDNEFDIQ
jgi:hypothetical protein